MDAGVIVFPSNFRVGSRKVNSVSGAIPQENIYCGGVSISKLFDDCNVLPPGNFCNKLLQNRARYQNLIIDGKAFRRSAATISTTESPQPCVFCFSMMPRPMSQ